MVEVMKMRFAGIDYIVIDKFKYDNKVYLMIIEDFSKKTKVKDLSKLEKNINIKFDFVYKCLDGMYENVTDDDLYTKLSCIADERKKSGKNDIFNLYYNKLNSKKD